MQLSELFSTELIEYPIIFTTRYPDTGSSIHMIKTQKEFEYYLKTREISEAEVVYCKNLDAKNYIDVCIRNKKNIKGKRKK